jgi:putative spermidine/putrescine transport system substrate-binding protein
MSDSPSKTNGSRWLRREREMTRRRFIAAVSASTAAATILPGNLLSAWADTPALPNKPVTLNIFDVAGNLQLTKQSIENYRKANPRLVNQFHYNQAPAPELPSKIKAQQNAGRLDIDLVLRVPSRVRTRTGGRSTDKH